MADPRTTGQRIRALREGFRGHPSIAKAADAIGISRSHLNMIETGGYKRGPGRDSLVAIADYFGVSIDYLLHGGVATPEPPKTSEFVDDPDEMALLRFWRSLSHDDRRRALNMLLAGFGP